MLDERPLAIRDSTDADAKACAAVYAPYVTETVCCG